MTQDETIELARQAGIVVTGDAVLKLCQLVAAKEREACAKIADEWAVGWPHPSQVIAERIRARGQA